VSANSYVSRAKLAVCWRAYLLSPSKGVQMNKTSISQQDASRLRAAIGVTRERLTELGCDAGEAEDLEALLGWAERELDKPLPNSATLAVPLNSVARSLAAEPAARDITLTLDAAMREVGISTSWDH
jgi:hypothetical protein